MKLKTTYGLIIILAILYSCSNPKTGKPVIEARIAVPKTKAEKLINQLRPETQKFQINSDSDNLITGKNGAQIFVPKNSFINADGELITGKVDIELIEVLSVADFIKTNLQTVSNGLPLQSEGMIYIDAKSGGQQITLAADKELQIELPNINKTESPSNIKIFAGSYDALGNINWIESGNIENRLIPLPLELFDYTTYIAYDFTRYDKKYIIPTSEQTVDTTTFNQASLKNTFIATREFEERYRYINYVQSGIGYYTSFYSKTAETGRIIKDSTISKIYLNNLDKDLWYCDSLAYDYIKSSDYFKHWNEEVNSNSDERSKGVEFYALTVFRNFYLQRLTTVISFPDDIDFGSKDAREKLIANGFSETEVDRIIGAYERKVKITTARRNKEKAQRITTNSFDISKLGWINCDQFYKDPTAKQVNILASVNNIENYEFAMLTLVINGRRVALNGSLTNDTKYAFTGVSEPYTKLPIGEKATIVGISYKDNKPYFGIKEIVISEKGNYDINLEASSAQDIGTKLNEIQ